MTLRTSSFYVLVLVAIMPLSVWLNAVGSPDPQDPRDVVLAATPVGELATGLSSSPSDFAPSADVCRQMEPLPTPVLEGIELFPGDPSVVGCGQACPRNCCFFGICMCH